jgi:hypothetical protein
MVTFTTFCAATCEDIRDIANNALNGVHTVLLIDNSGSMEKRSLLGTPWERAQRYAFKLATVICRRSQLSLGFLNDVEMCILMTEDNQQAIRDGISQVPSCQVIPNAYRIGDPEDVNALMRMTPFGGTPVGKRLYEILENFCSKAAKDSSELKPIQILCLLDGGPDTADRISHPLMDVLGRWGVHVENHRILKLLNNKGFTFSILLVEDDKRAHDELVALDDKLVGKQFQDFDDSHADSGHTVKLIFDRVDFHPYFPWGALLDKSYGQDEKGLLKLVLFLATSALVKEFDNMPYDDIMPHE